MARLSLMLVVLGLVGCERANHDPEGAPLPLPKVTVTLVDPGSEPRLPIRLDMRAGAKATLLFVRKTHIPDGSREVDRELRQIYTTELLDAGPGEIRMRSVVLVTTVDPPYRTWDPMTLVGTTIDQWLDALGHHPRASVIHTPDPSVLASRPELLVAEPEEPVGVGARWHEEISYGKSTASVDVQLLDRRGDLVRQRLDYKAEHESEHSWITAEGRTDVDVDTSTLAITFHGANHIRVHHRHDDVLGTEEIRTILLAP